MDISSIAKKRYTAKSYDSTKKIPDSEIKQLCDLLKFSPSSVNSQPWHFFIINTKEGKEKILPGIADFNQEKISNASHVVIFCAKTEFNDADLDKLLLQEENDGRFSNEQVKEQQKNGRKYFVGLNNTSQESLLAWESKQIYIALGNLLLGAATLGIDSTPIEGFSTEAIDDILQLKSKKLTSIVIAALGYHNEHDFNASLPKSRLPEKDIFTFM